MNLAMIYYLTAIFFLLIVPGLISYLLFKIKYKEHSSAHWFVKFHILSQIFKLQFIFLIGLIVFLFSLYFIPVIFTATSLGNVLILFFPFLLLAVPSISFMIIGYLPLKELIENKQKGMLQITTYSPFEKKILRYAFIATLAMYIIGPIIVVIITNFQAIWANKITILILTVTIGYPIVARILFMKNKRGGLENWIKGASEVQVNINEYEKNDSNDKIKE